MKFFVFTVFDSASGVYDRPFVANAEGSAIRSFGDIAANAEHPIGLHPEHYSLFRIGVYDDNKGEIIPEVPVCIAKAHELVAADRVVRPIEDLPADMVPVGNGLGPRSSVKES